MVTSGTGHDRCPSPCPGPTGARTLPEGSDGKISKIIFGFKRGHKKFGLGGSGYCERKPSPAAASGTILRVVHRRHYQREGKARVGKPTGPFLGSRLRQTSKRAIRPSGWRAEL